MNRCGTFSPINMKSAFYLDGLQLLDDVLQFLRERAIKDLALALPHEF